MKNKRSSKSIGVFGHVGNKNLGDEAIIAAVIENIKTRLPDAKIYAFTINPVDTTKRHSITAFPLRRIKNNRSAVSQNTYQIQPAEQPGHKSTGLGRRTKNWIKSKTELYSFLVKTRDTILNLYNVPSELKFLFQCYRNLKGINLLLVCGSQQLIDYVGGPWSFPYTLFKWTLIARIVNTKVAFLSVGAGPIHTKLGKFFARRALLFSLYRSCRDETSQKCIQELGISAEIPVYPDLAFSLTLPDNPVAAKPGPNRKIIGINPVPFYDESSWIGGGKFAYGQYIHTLAGFALWLIEKGYSVHLFPTQLQLDPPVIEDIKRIIKESLYPAVEKGIVNRSIRSLEELISALSDMDVVVATRYHGAVLSYALNKPLLGIAYHQKTSDLIKQLTQSAYSLRLSELKLDDMKNRFYELESSKHETIKTIQIKTEQFKSKLNYQYDEITKHVG